MIQHRSVPISEIRERGSLAPSDYLPRCPQAWHGGLPLLLVECKYKSKHRGQHRNQAGDLSWSGKLTDAEMETANALRGGEEVTETRATPIMGTVKMVEWGTCAHCGKDIFRLAPSAPWWHVMSGLTECRREQI